MNVAAEQMTAELAAELASNAYRAPDSRTIELRNSHLKAMGRSPAHCHHAMQFDSEPTLARRVGSGVHSLLLGGPAVVGWKGKQRRGKDFDSWRAEQSDDAIVLLERDRRRAVAIASAIRSHPIAERVLFQPDMVYEETIRWEWLGRARRCTPDARSKSHLVELKSCRTAEPEKFRWDAMRMGYHAQLADYCAAIEAQNGYAPKDVYIVAVEQLPPHAVVVQRLTAKALEQGAKLVRGWMERFLVCEESNAWPGYTECVVDFDVPDDDLELTYADDDEATATDGDA